MPLPSSLPDWSNDGRLTAILTWLATSIAVTIALVTPVGFYWLSYHAETRESRVAARLHGAFVQQAIGNAEVDWQGSVGGLIETDLSASELPEQRLIIANDGKLVSSSGPAVETPTLTQTVPLVTARGEVGRVVVVRSLRPRLWTTGLVALLSTALGAVTFLSLRILPLRALRRALSELRIKESESRKRLEEELQVVLDNVIDGVMVVAEDGRVVSGNRAAGKMLGYAGEEMPGLDISNLVKSPPVHPSPDKFPEGQYETVALRRNGGEFAVDVGVSSLGVDGAPRRLASSATSPRESKTRRTCRRWRTSTN